MIINEDDFEILESYLVSGGSSGSADLIERYAFQTLDSVTKEDYKTMKAKIIREGGHVEGIAGVMRCLRSTIRDRRSLYRLRSDYLTEHLHTQRIALFGSHGEKINLSMKNLYTQFQACQFETMKHEDLLLYTILYYIPEVDLKEEIIKA